MPLRGHLLVIGTLPLTFVSQIIWLLILEILRICVNQLVQL